MDPTAPEGCAAAAHGWSGNPLDTAHLRLRGEYTANRLSLNVEERLSGRKVGSLEVGFRSGETAELRGFWQEFGFAGESLRRCLRMLFDNFGIGLVEADFSAGNQDLTPFLREHGFAAAADGRWVLPRQNWLAIRASRKILLVVAAALIDPDGRVLLARRPEGKSMAGQWEFPGGKMAEGETPEQALIRELHEELGIDVTLSCLAPLAFASHDYDHFHLAMPLFALRQWSGSPVAREGQSLAWVGKDQLNGYTMPPADIPLVAQLRDWL